MTRSAMPGVKRVKWLASSLVLASCVVGGCVVSGCGTRVSLGELEVDEGGTTEPGDSATMPDTAPAPKPDSGGADASSDAKPVFDAAPDGGYLPCAGKSCNDECNICDPKQIGCVETQVIKLCDATGQCKPEVPSC